MSENPEVRRTVFAAFERIGETFVDCDGLHWVLKAVFPEPTIMLERAEQPGVTRVCAITSGMGRELRPLAPTASDVEGLL